MATVAQVIMSLIPMLNYQSSKLQPTELQRHQHYSLQELSTAAK